MGSELLFWSITMNKKTLSIAAAALMIAGSTATFAAELPTYEANGIPGFARAGPRARCGPCRAANDGACDKRDGAPGQRPDAAQADCERDHGFRSLGLISH